MYLYVYYYFHALFYDPRGRWRAKKYIISHYIISTSFYTLWPVTQDFSNAKMVHNLEFNFQRFLLARRREKMDLNVYQRGLSKHLWRWLNRRLSLASCDRARGQMLAERTDWWCLFHLRETKRRFILYNLFLLVRLWPSSLILGCFPLAAKAHSTRNWDGNFFPGYTETIRSVLFYQFLSVLKCDINRFYRR